MRHSKGPVFRGQRNSLSRVQFSGWTDGRTAKEFCLTTLMCNTTCMVSKNFIKFKFKKINGRGHFLHSVCRTNLKLQKVSSK